MKLILKSIIILLAAGFLSPIEAQNVSKKKFKNPLLVSGPDPWVTQYNGIYYFMRTTGSNLQIIATTKMSELSASKPVTVWTPPDSGKYTKQLWAPELHRIEGKWYIYFTADDGNNHNHRMYVVENKDDSPMTKNWEFKGQVKDSTDKWAIDATVFSYKNKNYMVWSGWEGDENISQNLYIAALSNPWTISGKRILISHPEYDWEIQGSFSGSPKVNEGPEILKHSNGNVFLTYSASGCWTDDYALGLLSLKKNGDPLVASDWIKDRQPVFSKSIENSAYGPGHNSFFKSPDSNEDWIIYHANPKPGQGCANYRSVRMQKFTWNKEGRPVFGIPQKYTTEMPVPSGE
ncbi:MAG: glycosyl hydrolase family 43 [Pseudopedobacter saltans]|uniref:Glycosyl hydrolase family 43 n=1 Tax=Pseudopedobacter saltans TaxID=151895 RepID=A0A2W5ETV9_9SPHI|nr:MAG: glycosyl hydrolase family 43 [Pseudopedobacter saltans]